MLSRRQVVSSSIAAGLTMTAHDVAAQPVPGRRVVDAQVHLWKAESDDWKWVPGMKPQMSEPFTIEKLVPLMDEAGVDRVVVVPPTWPGDRNDYGLEAARRYPGRFGVMGRIALQDPQFATQLPTWRRQPGMLGIRLGLQSDVQKAWLRDGTADWFWPAAEKAGLPVMFLAPGQLSLFAAIAERHPGLKLIIDHMGLESSNRATRVSDIPAAIAQAVALAKYSNVSVKMSGAPGNSEEAYPYHDMRDHLQRVFDAYGPERCHWASDMTNSFGLLSYRQRITHFTDELPFLSQGDKDWVMGRAILARLNWA